MNNVSSNNVSMANAGIPYEDINWSDIEGQPFGSASKFNVIVFNDANNIIDVEGPVAIGGSFYSPRGFSVGFPRDGGNRSASYSPDLVRFLVGGNVSAIGPLGVIGHVVAGGRFHAAGGSTYLIGKGGMTNELQRLKFLYQANGGSQYWTPTDKGDHYVVPSYDVPRFIPARPNEQNGLGFFYVARESIGYYKDCIESLPSNGSVIDNNHEWILRGNDSKQNVFLIDARPNGLINKGIRAEVPEGSTVIVRLRTGANAHLQYGVYGERSKANRTLYVFEDATNIYMEKSSDIWGSILAPQAKFHAHSTGGHVSGNAALRDFAVNANSGFEFHFFPFVGGVACPTPQPCPTPKPCPACPTPQPCPVPKPCPACPTPRPCPKPEPCPACPTPQPCPKPKPCPVCPTPQPCPKPEPCPKCPPCPTPQPCPRPKPCPICPKPEPCPECPPCPACEDCMIESGMIVGCIEGSQCCDFHEWDVKLYKRCDDNDILLSRTKIKGYGWFKFKVPYEGCYILKLRTASNRNSTVCIPIITLKNIGVANFMIE